MMLSDSQSYSLIIGDLDMPFSHKYFWGHSFTSFKVHSTLTNGPGVCVSTIKMTTDPVLCYMWTWNILDAKQATLLLCCSFQFDFFLLPKMKVLCKSQRFISHNISFASKFSEVFILYTVFQFHLRNSIWTEHFQFYAYFHYNLLSK